ncbi:tryptophan synthase subunit beta [Malaciobacter molluscorum LMG 25693]|uniref:Tryptophan synthase beta chain n=1 Tax=Malaciobacter molluscorum LMG 25693 TaxID=870501 RepID=A0A2G1DFK5_9BACT|nr:tryptophan synthase subunit beta [Malaciobacter molluscorum]AXX91770.1 tryptophan synthase, beta subunit [Malaciobacter molluscorum LMG 25693]PHO17234.1 tryptophan synthase subunit beta [Malaciobacter molluscorum LMG 25693]
MSDYIPKKSKFDPDENGHFGIFGGKYVPETLIPILEDLEKEYKKYRFDKQFWSEVNALLKDYVGRETPLYHAKSISEEVGAKVYLKREDLNHTGAHKVNNVIAQGLLAKKLGKTKVIAETGAGQHGVATATIAALLGLECTVFMGAKDVQRQELNVFRMKLLGAKVVAVQSGSKTLKDAMNDAIRYWVTNARDTFYIIGTVAGPHPYPMMVRDFQAIIGYEARRQIIEKENRLPDYVVACIGGGSNAIGMFSHFLEDEEVTCIGIEAGGLGLDTNKHGCSLQKGSPGVLHGQCSYLLQDKNGQVTEAHSISAGLDYPGIGPEHSFHKDNNTVQYDSITDDEAIEAFVWLSQKEGIIPAFESAHAIAYLKKAKDKFKDKVVIVNLSGRGDKDMIQAKSLLHFD